MAIEFECPKCGTKTLEFADEEGNPNGWKSSDLFHCTNCGDFWDSYHVKGGVARPRMGGSKICQKCRERPSVVLFSMPVPVEPVNWSRPIGYRMLKANLCSECYSSARTDRELAESLMQKGVVSDETRENELRTEPGAE